MDTRVQTIENSGEPSGNPEFGRYEGVDASIRRMASSILLSFGKDEAVAFLEAERLAQLGLTAATAQESQQNGVTLPANVVPRPHIEDAHANYGVAS